jgi:hypothetical protein
LNEKDPKPGQVMVWFQFLFYDAKLGFEICCRFSEIARLQSTKRFAKFSLLVQTKKKVNTNRGEARYLLSMARNPSSP